MAGFTTTAKYYQGIFIPDVKLPLDEEEVILTVVPKSRPADDLTNAIRETFGSVPELPDGVAYTEAIRKEWDERLHSFDANVPAGQ